MAQLAVTSIDDDGVALGLAPASGAGDSVPHGPSVFLVVENTGASLATVTIASQGDARTGYTVADVAVSVAAGAIQAIKLSNPVFRDVDGLVQVSYSSATDLDVGAFKL